MMRTLLQLLTRFLPEPRVIYDRDGGSPYLSRWYLLGERVSTEHNFNPIHERFNVFLHKFHRSDAGEMLHNHPWEWAWSLILVGGYSEELRIGDRVERREFGPGSTNRLTGHSYHRVDLLEEDAWTLFVVGPRIQNWYFWDRVKRMKMRWDIWINYHRGKGEPAWEPDSIEGGVLQEDPCPRCGCFLARRFECNCGAVHGDSCLNCDRFRNLPPEEFSELDDFTVRCEHGRVQHNHDEDRKEREAKVMAFIQGGLER